MEHSDLGQRMKKYEDVNRFYLTKRLPMIIRVDGKAFHSYTKGFKKPYDEIFAYTMVETGKALMKEIQGSKLAYIQSDEISILATDYEELNTEAWFDKNLQKIVSVSAATATACFNFIRYNGSDKNLPTFDSRAFVLPKEEVCNYFIWRQQDATRNSIQGLGQSLFSHKELNNLSCNKIQEKLFQEKHINWDDMQVWQKRGICLYKKQGDVIHLSTDEIPRTGIIEDYEIPIFTQDRQYIERYI